MQTETDAPAEMSPPKSVRSIAPLAGFFVRLALAILGVCGTLMLFEIGIRIISPQDLGYWDSRPFRRVRDQEPRFVENIPGGKANFIGVPVSINSMGLRGDEVKVPKPAHTVRILAVGDSITFGYGIRLNDTYAKVLEGRLNQNSANGMQYEVLNAGTLGGSLADYLHLLGEKARTLQPDIVLIGLCLNDILLYSEAGSNWTPDGEWDEKHRVFAHRLNHFALRHSQVYTLSYTGLKTLLYASGLLDMNKIQGGNLIALTPPSEYQDRAWNSSLKMLERLSDLCQQRGHKLVLVVFPMQMQMSEADLRLYRDKYHLRLGEEVLSGDPQRRLHEFALSRGLTLVDLLPIYRAYDSKELYFRSEKIRLDATHPSVRGNQVAAEEIFQALKSARYVNLNDPKTGHVAAAENRGR